MKLRIELTERAVHHFVVGAKTADELVAAERLWLLALPHVEGLRAALRLHRLMWRARGGERHVQDE